MQEDKKELSNEKLEKVSGGDYRTGKTRMCWICDKETEELIKTKSSENSMSFTAICSVCGTPYGSGSPFSK